MTDNSQGESNTVMYGKKFYSPSKRKVKKYELRIKRIGSLLLESYVPIESPDGIPLNQIPKDIKYLTSNKS